MAENGKMKDNRKKELLIQVSEMIDEAIRLGISGEELKIWWRSNTRRQERQEVADNDRGGKPYEAI